MVKINTKKNKLIQKSGAQDIFDWWLEKSRLSVNDRWEITIKKLIIKIIGIILLIIFSPILLAIFILVIAVSL